MIGDVLTSTILSEAIRSEYPDAELHYLINSHTLPVVEGNPFIDRIVLFTPEMEKSRWFFWKFLRQVRKERYDVVIDVYGKLSSQLITLFSGAKTTISNHKRYTSLFYSHTVRHHVVRSKGVGLAYENRLRLLEPICRNIDFGLIPKIYIGDAEKTALQQKLADNGIAVGRDRFAMINILGSDALKTYPLPYMAGLLDHIAATFPGLGMFLNYIPKQQPAVDELLELCQADTRKNIVTYYAPSLREFLVLTSFCNMVIGNEGGAINMGKALQIPTFAIFSPWIRTETWGAAANDTKNATVHLRDFRPELFEGYSPKAFKKKSAALYGEFGPEYIKTPLTAFIQQQL